MEFDLKVGRDGDLFLEAVRGREFFIARAIQRFFFQPRRDGDFFSSYRGHLTLKITGDI